MLLGMMGAGKTTTGTALAERLGWTFQDSDAQIQARTGGTGADLAARDGVEALHELEARVLLDALDGADATVVAAAASIVDAPRCRAALRRCDLVVWLEAPVDVLARRTSRVTHRRPMDAAATQATLAERERRFAEVADLRLDATTPTEHLVETIVGELGRRGAVAVE